MRGPGDMAAKPIKDILPGVTCPRCKGAGTVAAPIGIAARVVWFREERGFTRKQVEDGAKIAHSEYWRIENGKITDPSLKTVMALARFYKVSTDELLGFVPA